MYLHASIQAFVSSHFSIAPQNLIAPLSEERFIIFFARMMTARFPFLMLLLVSVAYSSFAQEWITPFETSRGRLSASYAELMTFYQKLDSAFETVSMENVGPTDSYYPLHTVFYSADAIFDVDTWHNQKRTIILINNGIHPGEPDGIDACMMLLRDLALQRIKLDKQVVIAIVPVFNIGGMLQRGSFSRANQNGPEAYGFRGNAQNLDLNRDFIKLDALETRSLIGLFRRLDPAVFVDTHVSNGADYQHVMTLLTPNRDKLGRYLGRLVTEQMEPALYQAMAKDGLPMIPYVNHWTNQPVYENGWKQFYEPPRFASGYAALWQTIPFVIETHMLKPFDERVRATKLLIAHTLSWCAQHGKEIHKAISDERKDVQQAFNWVIDWKVDTSSYTGIAFKGYRGTFKRSDVTGYDRLFYDRNKPITKNVPFYNKYKPHAVASIPDAYVLPQGWKRAVQILQAQGILMIPLKRDTTIVINAARVQEYETAKRPYEGHYLHTKVQCTWGRESVRFLAGDYIIPTNQLGRRYLLETLEPTAPDALFAWGFFDAALQQKEGYSAYVFEDVAARLLRDRPDLKAAFDIAKADDKALATDPELQLDFIYMRSPYFEPGFMRYPVYRIEAIRTNEVKSPELH